LNKILFFLVNLEKVRLQTLNSATSISPNCCPRWNSL